MTASAPYWLRRLGAFLQEQWIFAAVLGILWSGDALIAVERSGLLDAMVLIPASATMTLLAVLGYRSPVTCGWLAAGTIVMFSAVIRVVGAEPFSLALGSVQTSENAAGVLLLFYVFWKRPLPQAVPVGMVLVLACLIAEYLRSSGGGTLDFPASLASGFLQVVLAVGTGLNLRGRRRITPDTPVGALLRQQWPVVAALALLFFGDFVSGLGESFGTALVYLPGTVVMAALAVLGPLRPVRSALLGALTVTITTVITGPLISLVPFSSLLGSLPLTTTAAGMLLVAYVTRLAAPRPATIGTGALVVSGLLSVVFGGGHAVSSTITGLAGDLMLGGLLLVASIGTGLYFRARDADREQSVNEAISHAQQAERMALARELHDVVAHHVTGIVVQAQAAQVVSRQKPEASADALDKIVTSGTEALAAMRRLVASMRDPASTDGSDAAEQATVDLKADMEALTERANRASGEHGGPPVRLTVELDRPVPPEIGRSALRVAQEALTNAEKHALDATTIMAQVVSTPDYLHVRVVDDGVGTRAQPVGGSGGYGLVGMRERIELLGGRLTAGPGEHNGWCVDAWLPLDNEKSSG